MYPSLEVVEVGISGGGGKDFAEGRNRGRGGKSKSISLGRGRHNGLGTNESEDRNPLSSYITEVKIDRLGQEKARPFQ